ncbi:hypothetical protein NL108_005725 [Boleophthalmus pectinirostris]|uniref:SUMO-specific isopeptidase USPL1 n=1 Tax=Boleophthalmus pectinirostris TaxID=150288 RepID=UPI00242AA8DC|nr:SUMO-specific isopeptidase USPL1 [Boleophthalmus pectinirostris]KAJ0061656.1 hypothetical protein NL108_005725 [Boleophthalmus pectinirostris]
MVIFTDWFLSPVISRSACGLPMAGEDTGLEAVASPMVGYLGKVQERAASMDHCPWCHAKDQTYALRSYHLNLEESIKLCTNPQCLFPLVSRPLEDVLASLEPVESAAGTKRKSPLTLEANNEPSPKRPRLKELESSESQTSASKDDNVHNTVDTCNGRALDVELVDGHCDGSETNQLELHQQKVCIRDKDLDSCTDNQNVFLETTEDKEDFSKTLQTINNQEELSCIDARLNGKGHSFAKMVTLDRGCSLLDGDVSPIKNNPLPVQTEALGTTKPMLIVQNMSMLSDTEVIHSETDNMSFTETNPEKELVSAPVEIFWKNKDNLCWLDSLLVALVNLRSLRNLKPKDEPEQSLMSTLLAGFDEAYATIQSQQQTDKGGFLKVPKHLLHKINTDLETLRMSIFSRLQPKLQCKLGENETPVFALPLLLKLDSWLESLFQSTFYWDFRCTECKSNTKENVVKTLPTFTNIVPDWHPLRAVHLAPCNNCHKKNQRRKMVLQGVPPVFALHFVEGLPDNNIQVYNFSFKKKPYSVTAIIQYSSQLKHFVTWIHKSDGLWVEFDDLKHPHCQSFKTLPVPAHEIHVVFWEEEQRQASRACSPSTTFTESPPSTKHINHSATDLDIITNELLQCSPDQSLLNPQNISDITDCISEQDTTVTAEVDTTIGSTTLLDTFEGLTHNDIVTLTLVEIKEDSKQPLSNSTECETEQVKDLKSQNVNSEIQDSIKDATAPAPDSSTIETIEKSQENELSSESEPEDSVSEEDNLANDPTFEPQSKRRRKRARTVTTKQVKRPKVDAQKGNITKSIFTTPVQCKSSRSATSKPISPVSSTVPTLLIVPQAPSLIQPEQKGWSHLLERSLGHIQNTSKINLNQKPAIQLKRVNPIPSTPQQRGAVTVKVTPKPVLKTENSEGLPLKAADMYGAFGSKNTKPNSATTNVNKMPLESPVHKAIKDNTVVNNNSQNTSIAGLANNITSYKKIKSSKMPSGLSETEALRYKLFKKLKAKKKKLAKLNEMLGQSGRDSFKPDSTNNFSPNTVTSSTLDDEFFSDLLSPATTITSNLSPDSTDFLEMLANGQEATVRAEISSNTVVQPSTGADGADFLDEFMSQAAVERPSEMEEDALSALDLFL